MAKNKPHITDTNILEWMHSVGYFLPRCDKELERFERLHATVEHSVDIEQVNPFNIINGTWKPKRIVHIEATVFTEEITELRMAARKHEDIPADILEKIKQNQKNHGQSFDS